MPTVTVTVDGSSASCQVAVAAAAPAAQFGRIDYADLSSPPDAAHRRYSMYILQYEGAKTAAYVASLKAADPGVKVLMYKAMIARPSDASGWTTFLPWDSTDATGNGGLPANYFLRDASGTRVFSAAFGGMYFMDMGLPAYQQAALARAIGQAQASGFDGLYLDGCDTVLGLGALKPQPGGSASCTDNTGYLSALTSFLTYFAQQASASGLLSMGNIGGAYQSGSQAALWQQWAGLMDGAMDEFFAIDFKGAPLSVAQLQRQPANVAWSEANGKLTLLNHDVTAQAPNVYGLGLMLLAAGGRTCWNVSDGQYSGVEVWWPEYDTARTLGAPTGPYRTLPGGLLQRDFTGGQVTVNPTGATVGGLAPHTALIA